MVTQPDHQWVLLSYRLPREPSTPRIKIWRRLKNLGVAQIGDGLVALPHDARTKEHLEWVALQVREADGEAIAWTAAPTSRRDSEALAAQMRDERDEEYGAMLADIEANPNPSSRTVQRWRREWQRISRRDYFRAPLRDRVRLAIGAAAEAAGVNNSPDRETAEDALT